MDKNATLYDLTGDEILPRVSASLPELPAPDTKRWVARRKAVVVNAVRSGAISLEEACPTIRACRLKNSLRGSARSSRTASQVCA